jgi:hypothetical protein
MSYADWYFLFSNDDGCNAISNDPNDRNPVHRLERIPMRFPMGMDPCPTPSTNDSPNHFPVQSFQVHISAPFSSHFTVDARRYHGIAPDVTFQLASVTTLKAQRF